MIIYFSLKNEQLHDFLLDHLQICNSIVVDWSVRRRLLREQHELKTLD